MFIERISNKQANWHIKRMGFEEKYDVMKKTKLSNQTV